MLVPDDWLDRKRASDVEALKLLTTSNLASDVVVPMVTLPAPVARVIPPKKVEVPVVEVANILDR